MFDPLQSVNLAMRHHTTMPDVEVIWPGDVASPIDTIVQGGKSLIYHLCYESTNVEQSVADLQAAGLRVIEISPPKPAVLFGGMQVSFYNILRVGIIEIIDTRNTCS